MATPYPRPTLQGTRTRGFWKPEGPVGCAACQEPYAPCASGFHSAGALVALKAGSRGRQCGQHPKLRRAVPAADMDAFNLLLEMKLTRRRERPELPRTVTQLVAEDGSRVYVVGTAHFSDDSKRDVVKVSATSCLKRPRSTARLSCLHGSSSLAGLSVTHTPVCDLLVLVA